ncbi:N-acetylmuramoyl-L-alanine amidase [Streptomyces tirandamycinicus]|uniref:peptidoglycan recognition protein family protein n=1 Tax=Streptomyces tirandamycinicus TaxID=2174846 RepID=UPI00037E29C5
MAWCPFARKMELQPESDGQPAIRPTQVIFHSIAAPWSVDRLFEYWKSTSLESHFGLDYAGDLGQFIGTETRADANAGANRRPDGTGAVSIETASNTKASDPWTDKQVEKLIALGSWLHHRHGIPLRVCRSASDPGYGYHRLYAEWSVSGTACPGDARVSQFRNVVFPGIVARATGQSPPLEDPDMPSMLNESNAVDVSLRSGVWTGLAFTDAVVHSGPRRHSTLVHLLFSDSTHKEARIEGRFYLTDTAGGNPSAYLTVTGKGPGGHQFQCSADVPTGRHLRFEVRATTPDGSSVRLLHRVVSGPYWAL